MQARIRQLAADDIDTIVSRYRDDAGPEVAVDFVDQLEAAIEHLLSHPLTGSLRFAFELEIPDLRSWPLNRFPYLVFYVAGDEHIDIWRVLHARRDTPPALVDGADR